MTTNQQQDPAWRIAWRSERTGATGYGTGHFTYADATRYAEAMNQDPENLRLGIHHKAELWVSDSEVPTPAAEVRRAE